MIPEKYLLIKFEECGFAGKRVARFSAFHLFYCFQLETLRVSFCNQRNIETKIQNQKGRVETLSKLHRIAGLIPLK